ncbi:MAG: DegT/DnrJ/EryC1/StrS family aminotransferase [Rhizobiaceae bacterium]
MTERNQVVFARPFLADEEANAAAEAVKSGWVVGGPRLAEFEKRFAAHCQTDHAIGVSSWTAGGFLVLKALGIGPGDEVIVPSLTFIASVNVITQVGATPVFVDVDPRTFNLDTDEVARKIGSRTKAILPVDQLGLPCEIDEIGALANRHGLLLIQDAACSFGSQFRGRPVGAAAPVSVFSLHARKVVTTGEGGMIVTNDAALAKRLRLLRHQGMSLSDYERHAAGPTTFESYPEVGYNFRITDIQAAIGLCQLDKLDVMLARRREVAERYLSALAGHAYIEPPFVPAHVTPNWQSFQIRVRPGGPLSRNAVMERLHAEGVITRRGVMASHLEAPYRHLGYRLPATEAAAAECVQLPMHSGMSDADTDAVLTAVHQIYTPT